MPKTKKTKLVRFDQQLWKALETEQQARSLPSMQSLITILLKEKLNEK